MRLFNFGPNLRLYLTPVVDESDAALGLGTEKWRWLNGNVLGFYVSVLWGQKRPRFELKVRWQGFRTKRRPGRRKRRVHA